MAAIELKPWQTECRRVFWNHHPRRFARALLSSILLIAASHTSAFMALAGGSEDPYTVPGQRLSAGPATALQACADKGPESTDKTQDTSSDAASAARNSEFKSDNAEFANLTTDSRGRRWFFNSQLQIWKPAP